MATVCFKSVRAKVVRATLLDECGNPVPGEGNTLTTNGHISIAYSREVDEGEDILQRNGAGERCIDVPDCPITRWWNIEATFCMVDPDLIAMATGWPRVLDAAGDVVGFEDRADVRCSGGIALEVWTDFPGQACGVEEEKQYNYFLTPWITQFGLGDYTLENAAATFTLTGGKALYGSPWGVGPYDVVRDTNGDPSPLLEPFNPLAAKHVQVVTVPPPTPACGGTTLTPVVPGPEGE